MNINSSYFENKTCLIVTKHQKEQVIAPILKKMLGLNCIDNPIFDTDILGTFSGEVERLKDPLSTVKDKCLLATHLPDIDFIVASEGSFGNHPLIPFVKVDEEYICIYDKNEQNFIVEKLLFYETNFSTVCITDLNQLDTVLSTLKFPSHGIILRTKEHLIKDIKDPILIRKNVNKFLTMYGQCNLETDMRAMNNPTRMHCIGQLALKLANTLLSNCNHCGWHGFSISRQVAGLKCSICSMPTKGILYHLYQCKKCGFEIKKIFPNKKKFEDPAYCDYCNP